MMVVKLGGKQRLPVPAQQEGRCYGGIARSSPVVDAKVSVLLGLGALFGKDALSQIATAIGIHSAAYAHLVAGASECEEQSRSRWSSKNGQSLFIWTACSTRGAQDE